MKSGEAHCDQELADEIRRGGGRTRKDEERGELVVRSRESDVKSNNPHLAGGEQRMRLLVCKAREQTSA